MKIAMIHGQNHKGTTCRVGRMLAKKLIGEVKEFFLPKDFGEYCVGCTTCFMKNETKCPHYEKLKPLTDAITEVDGAPAKSCYVSETGRVHCDGGGGRDEVSL